MKKHGEEDEKGNLFFTLPESVALTDHKGKRFVFSVLKAQRSLSPAVPTADPDKVEVLLKKKGLWLNEEQQKVIQDLRLALRFVDISIDVSPDAAADLLFNDLITDREFEATLVEQKENFSFIPLES